MNANGLLYFSTQVSLPRVSKLEHDLRKNVVTRLSFLPVFGSNIVENPRSHHVPPRHPILFLLHPGLKVSTKVIVSNEGQNLGPLLGRAQDVLISQAKFFPILLDDLHCSSYTGMHSVIPQENLLSLVLATCHHLNQWNALRGQDFRRHRC